jgi:signal transduction histidine kinase
MWPAIRVRGTAVAPPAAMAASDRDEPWWPLYAADRAALLLGRVRLATALVLCPVVGLTAYQMVADPESSATRIAFGVGFVVQLSFSLALTALPWARRRAVATALVFAVGLVGVAATSWRHLPQDAGSAPLNAVAVMMGLTFLFPWGTGPEVLLCTATLAGYWWAAAAAPGADGYALGLLAGLVPVMVTGARVLERARRSSFQRTWQSERLASLARELAAHVEEDALADRALRLGGDMLGAQWASAMLYLPEARAFRVVAICGQDVERDWVGMEFPETLAAKVLAHGRLVLPDDDPEAPATHLLLQDGVRHAVYCTMRHGAEIVGLLAFARRRPSPFSAGDLALMRAIADQTGVALRTARLLTDLRRANTLKAEFVSTMSHELRTPINVILGFADMARDPALPGSERADCLRRIETAGADLLELVESTLEIGRLETQGATVRTEPIALAAFWAELRAACARLPRRPAVALEWADAPPVVVESDPRKLTVVLRNLVGNALKFTERGHVRVEVRHAGGRLAFVVADTGIGIAPEDRQVVFEMFRQADGSDSRRFGGTGLGLYLVRRFSEELGGTVELESAPGVGSTFTVVVPAALCSDAQAA